MLITMELTSWNRFLLLVSFSGFLVTRVAGQDPGPNAEASLAGDYDDDDEGGDYLDLPHDMLGGHQEPEKSLEFVRDLRNVTREQGESLKVRCEVEGSPPANRFKWFFNEAPLHEEAGRIKIKTNTKASSSQFSVIRFQELKFLDKGFYRCEASNDYDTIKKTFVINVVLNTGRKSKYGQDSDFLHIPDHRSYEDAFSALNSLSNGIDGLPDHIASEHGVISSSFVSGHGSAAADELPSLKPDEKVGRCEKYSGSACGASLGAEAMVWVSTDQTYVDERLSLTFQTITTSKMMSGRCSEYAIQAICLSTFPLCDKRTQRPRKLCREECEVLEADHCKSELETARSSPAIFQQLVFPECEELPALGSMDSHNCVRLGIPGTGQLLQPHSCYNGPGSSYRGTHSMTSSGQHCKPWREQRVISHNDNKELMGGHNYCRNPAGDQEMDEPWCFTDDRNNIKQVSVKRVIKSLEFMRRIVKDISK